jgi:hypothetical protein
MEAGTRDLVDTTWSRARSAHTTITLTDSNPATHKTHHHYAITGSGGKLAGVCFSPPTSQRGSL